MPERITDGAESSGEERPDSLLLARIGAGIGERSSVAECVVHQRDGAVGLTALVAWITSELTDPYLDLSQCIERRLFERTGLNERPQARPEPWMKLES